MIFNVGGNSEAVNMTADKVKYNDGDVAQELATLDQSVAVLEDELTANGTRIYLDYKDGKYGYNTSALRGADTFSPFKSGCSSDSDSDSDYTVLTTVNSITGDKLPTIYGCGYMILRRTSSPDGLSNIINVFIDSNSQSFPIGNLTQYTSIYGDYWKFYFQEGISFSNGKSGETYFYQTLLADSPVDKKYNIIQGVTVNTDFTTITGKGKILLSTGTQTATMTYRVDNASIDNSIKFNQYRCMEIMFNESIAFKTTYVSYPIYYIAYIEL